jgi:predicted RNA-binding protein associated with RNAse of E/G family
MQTIVVKKLDHDGNEIWRYDAHILESGLNFVKIEARFNRSDLPFHGILLKNNDRFIETYFTDKWYNIFEIHDRDDDELKAWYCNVGHPAQIEDSVLSYRDLALDLLVYPDGKQLILDEDEFDTLPLDSFRRKKALQSLSDLQFLFNGLYI